jgi:endonuclease/exonuclease/phosphatase family metal-dependent hydrolase
MTKESRRFRIATYNTHKCRGIHGKTSPDRIIAVIHELDADILCLQEVVNSPGRARIHDQAGEIARALPGYSWAFGANRDYRGGTYGNMTLTRLPLLSWKNHDVARRRPGREERGVLQTEIEIGKGETLHLFNVHLGTGFMERRYQARRLIAPDILTQPTLNGPRLVIGDFNEWTKGLTTRLLQKRFQSFRPTHVWRYPRTYPGLLPLLSLDHLYYEPPLALEKTQLWRTPRALVASDHLPVVADFRARAMTT